MMRLARLAGSAVLLALVLVGSARADGTSATPPAADAALNAAHLGFWAAYEHRDLWALSQIWDKDNPNITAAFPAASFTSAGWANVEENFRRSFIHNRDIQIDARIIRTVRSGNVAWIIGSVRFEAVQTQTGQFVAMDRMLTTELYRLRDGVWRLELYHGDYPGFSPPKEHSPIFALEAIATPLRAPSDAWRTYGRFIAAFQRRDVGGIFDLLTPERDASAIQPISAIPFLGPQNVIASWKKAFDEISAITIQPQRLVIDQDGDIAWISEVGQYHVTFRQAPDDVVHMRNLMATHIQMAHARLLRRPEQRRILIIISDGAPSDEATLAVSDSAGNLLENHLRQVTAEIDRHSPVELLAIGIGYDVANLYPNAVRIADTAALSDVLMTQLYDRLRVPGQARRRAAARAA